MAGILLVAVPVVLWMLQNGTIPSIASADDISYGKLCGIPPSYGVIWTYSEGFVDGYTLYRINLTRADFHKYFSSRSSRAKYSLPWHAPWWWSPPADSANAYTMDGDMKSLEIYDASGEILYGRYEW